MEEASTSETVPSKQDGGSAELTHEELMEVTSTALNDLLRSVTILSDLPQDVTLEEVNAQIAVQHGQSITVYVMREDGDEIAAVVNQKGARVIDLKHAIRRAVDLKVKRAGKTGDKRKISWKYVWKTNHLCFEGEKLSSDQTLLSDLGIRNKARVTFVKRLRQKGTVMRS
ncbi:hypothetical protein LSTR_LSTR012321 [Laodelphax striatellus]|uniref:SNRNP25 ubiquitin-like domain-containing protein n=1 Tax=Laodelphax striatellus TaxID=195883 RepID=A0A482WTP2_LAOST|nr:hypothetical protein LSTR_LSTR012321 [Laodelphax striatellus]